MSNFIILSPYHGVPAQHGEISTQHIFRSKLANTLPTLSVPTGTTVNLVHQWQLACYPPSYRTRL